MVLNVFDKMNEETPLLIRGLGKVGVVMAVWWVDKSTDTVIPRCSDLFIDKLAMTLGVKKSHQKDFIKRYAESIEQEYGSNSYSGKGYAVNKKVYDSAGETIFFQLAPYKESISFFRIEYNPSKVMADELLPLLDYLLDGCVDDLWKYGRVTRVDITTDVTRLPTHRLGFYYPGTTLSSIKLKKNMMQTAYLGSQGSPLQFAFYDKVAQMKDANGKKPACYKEELPEHDVTRIELKFRPKKIAFKDLYMLENKFQKLQLLYLTADPNEPKDTLSSFVWLVFQLSRGHGLQSALYNLPKYKRDEVKAQIVALSLTKWWQPEQLWKTWSNALDYVVTGH